MSAIAATQVDVTPSHEEESGPRVSPELESTILEIAASERALDDLLHRAERLHASHIQHDPASCLVCFTQR
ncbi:MAG TPA: hypothetical protein VNT31_16530 [Nocardioides sp.]|nr:hypothetical protein [Nocardioides sp.]